MPLSVGEVGPHTMSPGPRPNSVPSGSLDDASSCSAIIDMGRKVEAVVPISGGGGAGSPSNSVAWVEAYLRTKWHLDQSSRLTTIDMGRTLGLLRPFWGGAGSPFNAICGLAETYSSIPSGILIRPTSWPQYTNLTDRQTEQTNRQRSDSLGEQFYKRSPKMSLCRYIAYPCNELHCCSLQPHMTFTKLATYSASVVKSNVGILWSPYVIGQTVIFLPCDFYLLSSFFLFFLA